MQREKVKSISIFLLLVVLVLQGVEKKNEIDTLTEENVMMNRIVALADSLIRDTTIEGLRLAEKLAAKEKKIEEYENNKHQVVVTMYHPVAEQTDDTPNITADGTVIKISKASEYRYVAVSRNMLTRYGGFLRYGDYVWVDAGKKSGVYQVRDTMAPRWINRIDILETPGVKPYKYNEASLRRLDYVSDNL
jgi:3D (Asp-Asp-Asp) domain-containing protein